MIYIKSQFFDNKYDEKYNYSIGLESLIFDLQILGKELGI
jgi:hypothetical protein